MGATTQTLGTGDAVVKFGNKWGINSTLAMSSSYATNGDTVTARGFGLTEIDEVVILNQPAGYTLTYDRTNLKVKAYLSSGFTPAGTISAPTFTGTANVGTAGIVDDADTAATLGHALYVVPIPGPEALTLVAEGSATGQIKDSDTAATDGVLIYLVIDDAEYLPSFQLGHLEFVSPTTAHGSCTVATGLGTLLLEHDTAAATNGVEVRAIAASGGLEATIAGSGGTALVPLSDGQFLHIADSTTGSTPSIYFDEDAANTYERLQAVVVDNLDEPYKLAEVTPAVSRTATGSTLRLANLVTIGPGDSISNGSVGPAGGSTGPTFSVIHDGSAAQMVGATPLYVRAAGAGFWATLPGGQDVYVPVSTGEFLKVTHEAVPGTGGVQVYWDHDSTNTTERMKAVVVDNADETFSTEAAIGWRRDTPAGSNSTPTFTGTAVAAGAEVEVTNATDLSAVSTRVMAIGW